MSRYIDADELRSFIKDQYFKCDMPEEWGNGVMWATSQINHYCNKVAPSIDIPQWIPCSERLPKINQNVLLSTNSGSVFVGHRDKPDLIWQVTEDDGRQHWVYDPEAYTDDIDNLPKGEDCGFSRDNYCADGMMSVTSLNYDDRFEGVLAWMPLPKPYGEREGE